MSLIGRTYTFTKSILIPLFGITVLFSLQSCTDFTQAEPSASRAATKSGSATGSILVYEKNPVVLTGNSNLTTPAWDDYLSYSYNFDGFFLQDTCGFKQYNLTAEMDSGSSNCIEVKMNDAASTSPIQKNTDNTWNYTANSDEFYQVNSFYHAQKMMSKVKDSLEWGHAAAHSSMLSIPPAFKYNIANTKGFWLGDNGTVATLKLYSKCEFTETNINAFFDPALNRVCMGWNANQAQLYMAQDPSVVYHELGHVFVKIMMNQRNTYFDFATGNIKSIGFKSDLGVMSYDEAGAINEGIADFFSYFMTGRKYIGEWAMDRIPYLILDSQGFVGTRFGRPMDEDDSAHTSGVSSTTPGEKLSYPEYINYNPHLNGSRFEGVIHYAGQTVSHYLVRLTETFKNTCTAPASWDNDFTVAGSDDENHYKYASITLMLINETLAEIGDMTAKGSDYFNEAALFNPALMQVYFTNLSIDEAYLWGHQITPPNMRRFFKTFAKNIQHYISANLCPGFTKDMSEALLDEYGLLLFKSYGDAGQGIQISGSTVSDKVYDDYDNTFLPFIGNAVPFQAVTTSTQVNELNRKETVLVSKDLIDLPTDNRATAYVFDGRAEIEGILSKLTFEGVGVETSTDLAGVEYNNDNIKISPGEIVGVSLNLVNNSNSVMSGVQVLANDWDHMKLETASSNFVQRSENISGPFSNQIANWVPCQIDGWPLDTEGGVVWDPLNPGAAGDCAYTTRTNKIMDVQSFAGINYPKYEVDAPQPICMVQYSDENETKWVSQDFFRKNVLSLEDHECLNNETAGLNFNPNECLIRVLPGANQAVFGKIDPQKTWLETISEGNPSPKHSSSNITIMEVNKWIQPGTTFNCRFRVRFTNCRDCFDDPDTSEDYKDYEYAGMKPFKVINFSFKVID